MFHCGRFRASNIWFLDDTLDYTDRRLQLGVCPQCNREVGELFEKRKSDGLVRSTRLTRRKLDRLKEEEKYNIQYTSQDVSKQAYKKTFGWVYGVNTAVKSKSGATQIKQYACDFFGEKELIKTKKI